jgi:phage tail sheath protein FI
VSPQSVPAASTSVAAFVGTFAAGPALKPVNVRSAADGHREFGDAPALGQFFRNGGEEAWVVRADSAMDGLAALDEVDVINVLCIEARDAPSIAAARDWCAKRRAFFIADAPAGLSTKQVIAWKTEAIAGPNVAVYFPDLVLAGGLRAAPSSSIAGLYARMDKARGVWKAPAGAEATVAGASALTVSMTARDIDALTSKGVNAIRALPSAGIVAWGARTLSADSDWKYVPVRRLALFVEDSLDRYLQSAVFEPTAIRSSATDFLLSLWRAGALAGARAQQAFHVGISQADVDEGRLDVVVGIAPLRPAEFVNLHFKVHARDDDP